MFNDATWIGDRTEKQDNQFYKFINKNSCKGITILEFGAGTAIPSIRIIGETVFNNSNGSRTFVRINPEPEETSQFGKTYDAINDLNIKTTPDSVDDELIELKMSSLAAIELNPKFFESKPKEFWFFYGHRYNLYNEKNSA